MKTKQFRWLLTTLMLVAAMLMPIGASAAGLLKPSGDGSSSNPYQISTAAHLYWFAGLVNGTLPGGTDPYPVGSAYKLIPTALKKEDNTYWATFSDSDLEVTLSVPSGRTLNVYNATVSGGTLTLSKRNDCQVAVEEGVLLKTDGEYVNVKENEDNTLTPVDYAHNNLVATPSYAETITADAGYTLYRLTYNNVRTQDKLGFYLSLVKDENGKVDETSLGKKLKATPGKAYLNVQTSEATLQASAALARAFIFPNDDETTGIECITVTDEGTYNHGVDGIFDLQGRKVSQPTKGLYIKNNKKVVVK